MEEKKKWYDRKWAVRLLLIIFYPVGLYAFIRGKKPIVTMIVTTLLYGGFWTLVILTPSTPDSERMVSADANSDTQTEVTAPSEENLQHSPSKSAEGAVIKTDTLVETSVPAKKEAISEQEQEIQNTADSWERVIFEDLSSFNRLSGNWAGLVAIQNPEDQSYAGTAFAEADIIVSLEARFFRNPKKATDRYFAYKMTASYNDYFDSLIEALAQETSMPKIFLGGKKKEIWEQMMYGVEKEYDSEHISGETKPKNYYVESNITLSAHGFEQDFSRDIYMNASQTKVIITFRGGYINDFLPVSVLQIELTRK